MLFSELIAQARKDQGLLLRELAAAAELNEGYISSVENGKKNPCLRNAVRIVQALGLPAGVFSQITDPTEGHTYGRKKAAERAANLVKKRTTARARRG